MPDSGYWVGKIWIDVFVEEGHSLDAEVSSEPVEEGADTSDHINVGARRVTLRGMVSNHPIVEPLSHAGSAVRSTLEKNIEAEPYLAGENGMLGFAIGRAVRVANAFSSDEVRERRKFKLSSLRFDVEFDRVAAVKQAVRETMNRGELVQLILTGDEMMDMAITSFEYNVTAVKGGKDALHFTLGAQQVRTVATKRGDAPKPAPEKDRDKPATKSGQQSTADAGGDAPKNSFLHEQLNG